MDVFDYYYFINNKELYHRTWFHNVGVGFSIKLTAEVASDWTDT